MKQALVPLPFLMGKGNGSERLSDLPKLPGVHRLLRISYFRKHSPGASAWGCWKARDSQRLRPRTDPPDLPPRLFQKVPDLPKIPISLKSKPISSREKHNKGPCALQTSSVAQATIEL